MFYRWGKLMTFEPMPRSYEKSRAWRRARSYAVMIGIRGTNTRSASSSRERQYVTRGKPDQPVPTYRVWV